MHLEKHKIEICIPKLKFSLLLPARNGSMSMSLLLLLKIRPEYSLFLRAVFFYTLSIYFYIFYFLFFLLNILYILSKYVLSLNPYAG